jgi:putative membrane protein
MTRDVFVAVIVATFFTTASLESAQKLDDKETAFLQKAAQGQLAQIALGTLALKKASRKEVKEFGAEISEDHQYASQEIKELSASEGIYLPVELDAEHKKQQCGKAFDEAFVASILKNHRKDLQEFEKNTAMLRNEKVKQWAEGILPILTVHLKKAERVAEALGLRQAE